MTQVRGCFITNYLTPYQASLFAGSTVVICRHVDAHRRWGALPFDGRLVDVSDGSLLTRVVTLIRELRDADKVLIGGSLRMPEVALACVGCRIMRKPFALWLEASERLPTFTHRTFLRALVGGRGRVLAVGAKACEGYRKVLGPARVRPFPYSYGVAPNRPSRYPDTDGNEPLRVLFIGSEPFRKGLDLLLTAAADLEGILVTIVGCDPRDEDSQAVRWIEYLDPVGIEAALSEHDVLVLPSRFDGWGVVVEEAARSGVPSIVSDHVGASSDFVVDGYSGLVVVLEVPGSLRASIAELASDRALLRRLSSGAYERAVWHASRYHQGTLWQMVDR